VQAREALAALARQAGGNGTSVSNTLGHGIVGADLRTDPARLR
jgi:hypothetical protein